LRKRRKRSKKTLDGPLPVSVHLNFQQTHMDLERGRCLGASAVPVFTDQQKYENATGLKTLNDGQLPTWNSIAVLGDNGTDYAHAFAIMTLDGSSASVKYYQVPVLGTASELLVTDSA
jgi:hypothetical protein